MERGGGGGSFLSATFSICLLGLGTVRAEAFCWREALRHLCVSWSCAVVAASVGVGVEANRNAVWIARIVENP